MPSTHADRPVHSPALRQRLRARARRVSVLRRRVGALTIALFLATFGAISATGALGKSTSNVASAHVASARVASAHVASAAATDYSPSVSSEGASTTSGSVSSTATSSPTTSGAASTVTTSQS
jgi:hypothetical protein